MARGDLNGTFYVPNSPTYVSKLDISLSEHENALVAKFLETYPAQFTDAVFSAVNARVAFHVDCFVRNDSINTANNVLLERIGEV